MRFAPALLMLLATLPFACVAQGDDAAAGPTKKCRPWMSVPIPQNDMGTAPKDCDAATLYYGTDGNGTGADYAAARRCAYHARNTGHPGNPYDGSGLLMMVYANGQGVPRNIPLAKRFSCEAGGWPFDKGWAAPAEIEGRLAHLDAIARGKNPKPMDFCDDITSGDMMGWCSGRDADFAQKKREMRWTQLQTPMTPDQRAALKNLRAAAKTYFDNVAHFENDMSGTAREAIAQDANEALDIDLLKNVERTERDRHPPPPASDFAQADNALNTKYRQALAQAGTDENGGVTGNGVRITQRSWLLYREAWVTFGTARYPNIAADAWRAWQTQARTKGLACIADFSACDGIVGHDE